MSLRSQARNWLQRLDRVLAAEHAPLADPDPTSFDPVSDGPKIMQATARDGSTKIYSVPGTLIAGGFLSSLGEFNPLLMGREAVRVWEKMRRTSSQVDKTLEMCIAPIVDAKWDVVPDPDAKGTESQKKEIARAARENLFGGLEYTLHGVRHTQTWNEVLRNILLMLPFGCSAYEEVYAVDGSHARLAAMVDMPPKTFYQWDVEEDGRTLRALIQLGYRGQNFERVEVPAERINVFTYRREGADFWGRSILRAAYSHWYAVSALYAIRNIGAERTSVGVPCITLPPNASAQDRTAAVAYVTQLAAHQRTGLVLPNGATFEIVAVKGQTFNSMEDVVHHNEQISFVALDFFSNLGRGGSSGTSGNRSLAQGQGKFFMLALQNTAGFVEQRITNVTLKRWTTYNYGPDAPVPLLRSANVQARSFEEVMDVLTKAAQTGLVKSDKGIRDFIRTETGAPQETDEDVIAIRGETVTEGAQGSAAISGRSAATVDGTQAPGNIGKIHASEARQPVPGERHYNWGAHEKRIEATAKVVARVLRKARRRRMEQWVRAILVTGAPGNYAQATLPRDRQLETQMEEALAPAREFGKEESWRNRKRATGKGPDQRPVTFADKKDRGLPPNPTPIPVTSRPVVSDGAVVAQATLSDYDNWLRNTATGAATVAARQGRTTAAAGKTLDEIVNEITDAGMEASDANIDRFAERAAIQAIVRENILAMQAMGKEVKRIYRTEILDKNTCDTCFAGNGQSWPNVDAINWFPGDDCEGGMNCRGGFTADFLGDKSGDVKQ